MNSYKFKGYILIFIVIIFGKMVIIIFNFLKALIINNINTNKFR